ncbi:MAG: hypothetical protein ACI8QZ_003157 [Chlamydiales bacterium]|jgi:hypothetical protein
MNDPTLHDSAEANAAPSFRALLAANLRVVLWASGLALVCFGVWRGLRGLFPDVQWLQ